MSNALVAKILNDEIAVDIEIDDDQGRVIGHLRPITKAAVSSGELIERLTDWRNRARQHFFTQFTATFERTRCWLNDVLLPDERRLLFIINSGHKPVGQLGFRDLTTAP